MLYHYYIIIIFQVYSIIILHILIYIILLFHTILFYCYIAGTTGHPKAVMCSHDNLIWCCKKMVEGYDRGCHYSIGYLPYNHIAGLEGIFMGIVNAATIYYAPPDAMKGSLLTTLQEVNM